jgi:hypothetical protein
VGGRFHLPVCTRDQHLHRSERAGDNAGFAADASLLINLHRIIDVGDGTVRAAARAGGGFAVVTGHRAVVPGMFDNGNTWIKHIRGKGMLLVVMRHYAGHFAGMTSNTVLAIRHNKTVHGTLLDWLDKPYLLYDYSIYRGACGQAMSICPERLSICHEHVADQFISAFQKSCRPAQSRQMVYSPCNRLSAGRKLSKGKESTLRVGSRSRKFGLNCVLPRDA